MEQQLSITEVIQTVTQSMKADGITQEYINQLSHTWNALSEYLSEYSLCFNRENGILFLKEKYGISSEQAFAKLRAIDKRRKRAVFILIYCAEGKSLYREKLFGLASFQNHLSLCFLSTYAKGNPMIMRFRL